MRLRAATKQTRFESSEKGSIKSISKKGCHERFYRHIFSWFIYPLLFETSGTASCGPMLCVSICLAYAYAFHQYVFGTSFFSRMRSEGFPFIVGVWGWTCVRVVLVVSSSSGPRRVLVGASSTPRRVVNFSPMGGTRTMRHNHVLQKMKSGGGLARNARFGA